MHAGARVAWVTQRFFSASPERAACEGGHDYVPARDMPPPLSGAPPVRAGRPSAAVAGGTEQ
ncbi:hypothetical protein ABZW18_01905 [Streptomyces sp. NPDC004647]|uniref:hypothetical protein n=1 Tax=Streptomyces sp. NPDC004647 TaxID=3154671 RepID=UPI00339F86D5